MLNAVEQWALNIAGVALLGVLLDLLVPEGRMQKFCRTIFALIMLLAIISPLPGLISSAKEGQGCEATAQAAVVTVAAEYTGNSGYTYITEHNGGKP